MAGNAGHASLGRVIVVGVDHDDLDLFLDECFADFDRPITGPSDEQALRVRDSQLEIPRDRPCRQSIDGNRSDNDQEGDRHQLFGIVQNG